VLEFSKEGKTAKVKVDDKFDLYHLEKIISRGDLITARTERNIFIQREEGKEKSRKKSVVLKIKVEKVEFDKNKNKLRLNGRIVEAPEEISLGDYHTIEVGFGLIIEIEKQEWSDEQLKNIQKAQKRLEFLKDFKLLEEFYAHLNKQDGLVAYGLEQVRNVAEYGMVKVVFINEEKVREFEELIEKIMEKKGEVKLISIKNPKGREFCKVYEVAAILRFPIS